jgi:hypothetical protein
LYVEVWRRRQLQRRSWSVQEDPKAAAKAKGKAKAKAAPKAKADPKAKAPEKGKN